MLIVTDGKNAVGIGCVFANYDGDDAVECFGAAGVDALDARVRVGRMQNLPDQHAGQAEVVGVLAGACSLLGRVDHRRGLADNGEIIHLPTSKLLQNQYSHVWCRNGLFIEKPDADPITESIPHFGQSAVCSSSIQSMISSKPNTFSQ